MSENKQNKKSKFELNEQMLVIVNKDWSRTYVASIKLINAREGLRKYFAKCEMKNSSIVCTARDKNQLSTYMDELATIIEDCVSGETLAESPVIAGIKFVLN